MDVGRFPGMRRLYFDDLSVGERFTSERYTITADAIIAFAREFDVQPFHTDPQAAEATIFKGHAASGWHTAAIAMRLFTTGPLQFVGGCVGLGVDELRWPVAVRPGDVLQLETEILDLRASRSKPGQGIARIRNVLRNQKDEIVLSYTANAIGRRRPNE